MELCKTGNRTANLIQGVWEKRAQQNISTFFDIYDELFESTAWEYLTQTSTAQHSGRITWRIHSKEAENLVSGLKISLWSLY